MIDAIKNNKLSIIAAIIIMYLSLASSNTIDEVTFFTFPYIDKVVHFCMYLTLMLCLLYEHRYTNRYLRGQLLMAIMPAAYGILMELIQAYFTKTRSGDISDALFNIFGILTALVVWRLFFKNRKS